MVAKYKTCAGIRCDKLIPIRSDGHPDGEMCNDCNECNLCGDCWDENGSCNNPSCEYNPKRNLN